MPKLLACLLGLCVAVAACSGGSSPTVISPANGSVAPAGASRLTDVEFAWCIDPQNEPKLSKAATSVGTDLDHLQATYADRATVDAYNAALRADSGYIKACRAGYATK